MLCVRKRFQRYLKRTSFLHLLNVHANAEFTARMPGRYGCLPERCYAVARVFTR